MFRGDSFDFHGYTGHLLSIDGCAARIVAPKTPLPNRPWVWRTMFWDAFPKADIALLDHGFHVAFINVGNTFGNPESLLHFDTFYKEMTATYRLSSRPALEGLSRGGLSAYHWASAHTDKVACLYGDAPVCDMKSWPGGKGKGVGSSTDWKEALRCYHFTRDEQMLAFTGNPIDLLAPLAAAHISVLHVYGDADTGVPPAENTDILRERYLKLGGDFTAIVKKGCGHHPHGLSDPTPIVNFITAHAAQGQAAETARRTALKPGTVTVLAPGVW